jgi:hypothetical protein
MSKCHACGTGIALRSEASDTVFGLNLVYEVMSDMSEVNSGYSSENFSFNCSLQVLRNLRNKSMQYYQEPLIK